MSLTYDSGSKSRLLVSDNAAGCSLQENPHHATTVILPWPQSSTINKIRAPGISRGVPTDVIKRNTTTTGGSRRSNRIASDDCKHPSALREFTLFRLYFQASKRFFSPCIVFLRLHLALASSRLTKKKRNNVPVAAVSLFSLQLKIMQGQCKLPCSQSVRLI